MKFFLFVVLVLLTFISTVQSQGMTYAQTKTGINTAPVDAVAAAATSPTKGPSEYTRKEKLHQHVNTEADAVEAAEVENIQSYTSEEVEQKIQFLKNGNR